MDRAKTLAVLVGAWYALCAAEVLRPAVEGLRPWSSDDVVWPLLVVGGLLAVVSPVLAGAVLIDGAIALPLTVLANRVDDLASFALIGLPALATGALLVVVSLWADIRVQLARPRITALR